MFGFGDHEDFRPVFYVRGYPIYMSGVLVLVHVAAFILTAILLGMGQSGLLMALAFNPGQFFSGYIWQLFTYPLVKVMQMADPFAGIWFLIEMALLWTIGKEIERYLGRWNFLNLYTWLILIPSAVASLLALAGANATLMGSFLVHAGVFFAFAALYPGVMIWGSIQARWLAIGFGAVWTLIFLAQNNWAYMFAIWANGGYAFLAIKRFREGHDVLFWPDFRNLKENRSIQVLPDPEPPARKLRSAPKKTITHSRHNGDPRAQLDALLDKIAEHGIGSLSQSERKQLELLREKLLEQEGAREDRS